MAEDLSLQSCNLACVPKLTAGQWPKLHSLSVAHNALWVPPADTTQTPWPGLKRSGLKNSGLKRLGLACTGLKAIAGDVLQSWSTCLPSLTHLTHVSILTYLSLSRNDLSYGRLASLCRADLPCINCLKLQCTGKLCCELIVRADWPLLESLDLSESMLTTDDINTLKHARWPWLKSLYLCNTGLNMRKTEFLTYCQWPKLELLNQDDNGISADEIWGCIYYLVSAQWPLQ